MTREETIQELGEWLEQMIQHGVPSHSEKRKALATAIALLSAEAVPRSEQYKKGFEDAKRAFLIEYARESENMRRRNAQLEVMINAQNAILSDAGQGFRGGKIPQKEKFESAEAVQGWIPVSKRLPEKSGWYLVTIRGYETVTDVSLYSADGSAWGDVSTKQTVLAWMPLPEPYREDGEEE